jgi:hypothetical protein
MNVKLVTSWRLEFKTICFPLTMDGVLTVIERPEIKMEGNEYYTKIHEEFKKYGVEKLTAAQMGFRVW